VIGIKCWVYKGEVMARATSRSRLGSDRRRVLAAKKVKKATPKPR